MANEDPRFPRVRREPHFIFAGVLVTIALVTACGEERSREGTVASPEHSVTVESVETQTSTAEASPSRTWEDAKPFSLVGEFTSVGATVRGSTLGFAVADTTWNVQSMTSYDPIGRELGSRKYHGDESELIVIPTDNRNNYATIQREHTQQEGLTPPMEMFSIVGYSTDLSTELWKTKIVEHEVDDSSRIPGYIQTDNGRWIAFDVGDGWIVIDGSTGSSRRLSVPGANTLTVAGDYLLATRKMEDAPFSVIDPESFAVVKTYPASLEAGSPARILSSSYYSIGADRVVSIETNAPVQVLDVTTGTVREGPMANYDPHETVQFDPVHDRLFIKAGGPMIAVDLGTMRQIWSLPDVDYVCTATHDRVLVDVDDQLVIVDAATGKQIDYTKELEDCGRIFGTLSHQGLKIYKVV